MEVSTSIDRYLASPGLSRVYPAGLRCRSRGLRRLAATDRPHARRTSTFRRSRSTPPSSVAAGEGSLRRRSRVGSPPCGRSSGSRSAPRACPEIALPPRRRRRLPDAPKLADVEAVIAAVDGRRAARAPQRRDPRAHLLVRSPERRGRRAPSRRRRLRPGDGARPRQGRQGARRPARRAGGLRGRRLSPRRQARHSRAVRTTRSSSRSAVAASTRRRCGA